MNYIILLLDGTSTKVSQEDSCLQQFTWNRDPSHGYIVRKVRLLKGKSKKIYLHREVASRMTGISIDELPIIEHLNGERNDNRRENLRLSNQTANALRSGQHFQRGACWCEPRQCWTVQISFAGRTIHLGGFKDQLFANTMQEEARASLLRLVETTQNLTVEEVFAYFKGNENA